MKRYHSITPALLFGDMMRILIVEDDEPSRIYLERVLEKAGFEVKAAEDGLAAWDLLQSEDIRLVITDWVMPRISGLELCERIRKKASPGYIFIIVVTSKDSKSDIVMAMDAGADDYVTKPYDKEELLARVRAGSRIISLEQELERRNHFIRKTFGRYTSDEIVEALLDVPDGLKLGGEKRVVTLLMSDLRGFTTIAERLDPSEVVLLLNHYLSGKVEVIQRSGGTIDEIIGDSILVIFGAPLAMEAAAKRAVLCALEMQKTMGGVNEHNLRRGWPELEMGIALHTGEVVVGNIGSTTRSKYGVVGRTVNLASRIESFTVGGQVLVSPALIGAANHGLILGDEVEIHAKGMREAFRCREVLGHEDYPELTLAEETKCTTLAEPVHFHFVRLTDKHLAEQTQPATLVGLSRRRAVIEGAVSLPRYTNIMLRLEAESGEVEPPELYAKVIRPLDESCKRYLIHLTSATPEMRARLHRLASKLKTS